MKLKAGDIAFSGINYFVFILFSLLCVYPFYYLLIVSLSDSMEVAKGLVYIIPLGFNVENYIQVLQLDGIGQAFLVSVSRVVLGTAFSIFISALFAYVLTKKELAGRKFMYRAMVLTMYISGGLIPWFITMKAYGLQNNFLLYILPGLSPFTVILLKTYIESISPYLEESALIDGAGYFTIFLKIVLPVSKPAIAAMSVMGAVSFWNEWQTNFFLVSNPKLQTMQLLLLNFLREAEAIAVKYQQNMQTAVDAMANKHYTLSPYAIKTTITIVAAIPIICVYPMLQKYFVKGIMIGAIKG